MSGRYTHFGQLKGTIGKGKVKGVMIKGDPIFSLTANNHGLMVRFSNRDSTDNFHEGLKKHLSWSDSTGQWVHVKIVTTFGESMVVGESDSGNGSDSDRKQGLPEDVLHVRTGNPRHASKQARTYQVDHPRIPKTRHFLKRVSAAWVHSSPALPSRRPISSSQRQMFSS